MTNIIDLENVSKSYKRGSSTVNAISDLSLKLMQGESLAIIGPSGSGKSTLLNIMGALDKPSKGKVRIGGQPVEKFNDNELSNFRNQTIGFIFQFFNLQDYQNVWENVALPLIISGESEREAKAKAHELLKRVGLESRASHYPRELSGGEMQRAAIARSLANDPKILLADEPTANLDKKNSGVVMDLFSEIGDSGVSVVVITHDSDVSKRFSKVVHLSDGKILN